MTPEMWDIEGNRTLNGEEAMFVKVDEDMMPVLFDKYGKGNFPGLDEECIEQSFGLFLVSIYFGCKITKKTLVFLYKY